MLLSNDDYLFSEIRNKNIAVIPQALQNKLYEMQSSNSVVAPGRSVTIAGWTEATGSNSKSPVT